MSLLNSIIKAAASSILKENPELLNKGVTLLTSLVSEAGGLPGLIKKFQDYGLSDIINSWMSSGEKLPISSEQLTQVFGSKLIQGLAEKTHLDEGIMSLLLTSNLPKLVGYVTEDGKIAPQDVPDFSSKKIQGIIEQLLS